MSADAAPAAPPPEPPSAPAPTPAAEGGGFLAFAAGASILAACADLLAAVLLGLTDVSAGAATRFDLRDLGLCAGAASLLSFALAAASWSGGARGLAAAAAVHLGVAAAAWFGLPKSFGGLPVAAAGAAAGHLLASALALGGALAVRGAPAGRMRPRAACAARSGAENLESVLVAIAFALVIRHFAVEAYKIPTGSMEPTLLGDRSGRGPGDRVLVAKWPALLGGPDRWEIWVFRPPLERTINYVKRVGGLPGETIRIEHGDLYADGRICRKPPHARESLWFPVWPAAGRADRVPPWSGPGFRKEGEDGFAIAGAPGPRLLTFERAVRDGPGGLGGADEVGDLRLRFRVDGAEPGTEFAVRITGRGGPCEFRVAADGSSASAALPGSAVSIGRPPGAPVSEVEVWFADLEFGASVNGTPVFSTEVAALPSATGKEFGAAFGVAKGGATFRGVRLDRDVHYTGSWTFRVPEGHWFFLGDNSGMSEDSRKWETYAVRETGGAGRVFHTLNRTRPLRGDDGLYGFRDRDGIWRSYEAPGIRTSDSTVPMSFVPAEDLHGRAFAVFWPPRWFTQVPGGRVGLVP